MILFTMDVIMYVVSFMTCTYMDIAAVVIDEHFFYTVLLHSYVPYGIVRFLKVHEILEMPSKNLSFKAPM